MPHFVIVLGSVVQRTAMLTVDSVKSELRIQPLIERILLNIFLLNFELTNLRLKRLPP